MRVVVLGGSGFLGHHLTRRLTSAGLSAVSLASHDVNLEQPESSEILSRMLSDAQVLVFLSMITREKGRDPETHLRNIRMGAHVATSLSNRLGHAIYVSSDAVYGDAPALPITERTPTNPSCLYGAAHVARELMMADACATVGVSYTILRSSMLYGPGDTHGSYGPNRFFRTAPHGVVTVYGRGEERRDTVYVDDAVALIERVIATRTAGVFNIATGRSHTFDHVANLVAAASPGQVRIEFQPRAADPIIDRDFDVSCVSRTFPDFRYTPLAEGIARTAAVVYGGAGPVAPAGMP